MKPALVCGACAAEYDPLFVETWGRSAESDGYGPTVRCVELVESVGVKAAPDGSVPMEWCGGLLSVTTVANDRRVITPTPIEEGVTSHVAQQIRTLVARIEELEAKLGLEDAL